MITPGVSGLGPVGLMVRSLERLSASEAAAIRPRVIDVVTVKASDTVQSLAGRMAYDDYRLERFLVLNSLSANSQFSPGSKVKLVVYGTRYKRAAETSSAALRLLRSEARRVGKECGRTFRFR